MSINVGDQTYTYSSKNFWETSTGPIDFATSMYFTQQDLTLTVGDSTISIPKGTITATQLDKIGNVLEGLTLSEATTGPSRQQKIDEALGKIHDIIGGHPHLGNEFSEEIYELLHPETAGKPEDIKRNKGVMGVWEDIKIVNDKGIIDFSKLGLTQEQIQKAGISGKMWIDENGKFQMDVTFNFGQEAVAALKLLKDEVNKHIDPSNDNSPISFNPEDAGTLESTDLAILERGGQIQFKSLPSGKTLKLVLEPGEDGQGDELTIQVRDKGDGTWTENPRKIPLSAVFEGQEHEGHRVRKDDHPILENWRTILQDSFINIEKKRLIPFTARFDRLTANNTNDPKRIQASNTLWDAVYTYLGATLPRKSNSDAEKLHTEAGPQASTGRTEELSSTMRWGFESPGTQSKVPAHLNSIPTLKDISEQASGTLHLMPLGEISATSTQGTGFGVLNLAANEDNLLAAAHSVIDAVIQLLNAKEVANVTSEEWGKLSVLIENLITTLGRTQTFSTDPTYKQRLIETVVTALREAVSVSKPENVDLNTLLGLAKIVSATVNQFLSEENNIKNFKELLTHSNELNILTLATCTPKDPQDYIPFLESIIQGLGFKKEELTDEFVPEKMFLTSKPYVTSMLRNNTSLAQRQLAAYLNQKINVINDPQTKPEDLSSVGTDLKELATFLNDQIKARVKIFPEPESSPGNATQ